MLDAIKERLRKHTKFGENRYLRYLLRYDEKRFAEHSSLRGRGAQAATAEIRVLSHAVEKAMSLPECRPNFGKEKILKLIELYEAHAAQFSDIDPQIEGVVCGTIQAYAAFQKAHGIEPSFIPARYLEARLGDHGAGVVHVPPKEATDFAAIASRRKSARYYGAGPISPELVKEAVQIAQTAPSACNRQSTRVYACLHDGTIDKIMALHPGVKGFGKPGAVFVLTGDLSLYQNEMERHTVFIDGGLFAMNLLYALDCFGLVSCPAIWGSEPDHDRELAALLGIPANETVLLLILSGRCPEDGYDAAVSGKRDVSDVLRVI